MRWVNSETPTFAGSAGSGKAPAVVETMSLIDRLGNIVSSFTKGVDGTVTTPGSILEVADGGRLLFSAPPPLGFRVKDAGFVYELIDPDNYDSVAGWIISYPAGMLGSTQVHTNVGTKQALYTVPAGYKCVVTDWVLRDASSTLVAMADDVYVGFTAGGDQAVLASSGVMQNLIQSKVTLPIKTPLGFFYGAAGEVLGMVFFDTNITATLMVDVFGYLIKA